MANYNRVFLMGNLTRDPQLRYTPSQQAVCDFGLAINRKWKGADGQMHEEVCFVDCTAWGRTAENIQKYLGKGQPLFVEGRLSLFDQCQHIAHHAVVGQSDACRDWDGIIACAYS